MVIVDAQVHIWGANTPERPWPARHHQPHRAVPLEKDALRREMDAAGVARACRRHGKASATISRWRRPNVVVKASALPCFTNDVCPTSPQSRPVAHAKFTALLQANQALSGLKPSGRRPF